MIGIKVLKTIGIGDAIQFTSLPENYFKATGEKLVDTESHWVFDHNPYVVRGPHKLDRVLDLWELCNKSVLKPRNTVFLSLAEKYCHILNIPVVMKYPRLYFKENYPIALRSNILLHFDGKSHGALPQYIIDHVLQKYEHFPLFQIGVHKLNDPSFGIPKINTPNIWDLVSLISESRMLIGVDSGPAWIACCYPDVVVKKIRLKPTLDILKTWVPLDVTNLHAQWDDHTHQVFNPSENDVGFTASYKRL